MRKVPLLGVALLGAVAVFGCSSAPDYGIGPPPSTQLVTTVPAAADSSGVKLDAVPPGRTTTTAVAVTPGPATVGGVVMGPGGAAVPGATVRLERLVGEKSSYLDVVTGPDGRWSVAPPTPGSPVVPGPSGQGLMGGLYHVRAWRAPDLVQLSTATVNVLVGKPATVDLTTTQLGGVLVAGDLSTDDPRVNQPVALVIQYTVREVTAQGQVEEKPMPGTPVLGVWGAWTVNGGLPVLTDVNGRALLYVQCTIPGRQQLFVGVADLEPAEVAAPTCKPPLPPTTDTTRAPVVTTSPQSSTTVPPIPSTSGFQGGDGRVPG